MTEGTNIFSRSFRVLVMLHKIPYAYLLIESTDRQNGCSPILSIYPGLLINVREPLSPVRRDTTNRGPCR